MLRRVIAIVLAASLSAIAFTGCNTMKGFGKDMERGGEGLQDKAEREQKY